jgi:putative inorganic carbon (HCO3(-)) transporter
MSIRFNEIWKGIQLNVFLPAGVFLLIFLSSIYGGMIWNGLYVIQISFFFACLGFVLLAFLYRRHDTYAKLPKLGIEWAIAILLLAIISSWVLSPLPRQGIWRMSTLVAYFPLLYLLVDLFVHGLDYRLVLRTFFLIVGVYLFTAVLETVLAYQEWFTSIDSIKLLPPTIYRFSSLLGHSNALMACANLLAPIGVINLFTQKKFLGKFSYLLWFVLYGFSMLFSSSRGGYLGLLVWISVLLAYGIFYQKSEFIQRNQKWIIRILILTAIIVLVLVLLFGGYLTSHPTHGSRLLSSREVMWLDALQIWRNFPVFGAGPGRIPFEILNVNATIPPRYFPNHVHSTWLQFLAEFGIAGLLSFLFMSFKGYTSIINKLKTIPEDRKTLGMGFVASFAGFFVHSILDDFTGWIFVMGLFLSLLAMFFSIQPEKMAKWREINLRAIFLPIGILFLAAGYSLWSQIPFRKGIQLFESGQYQAAAQKISESIKRDPFSSYLSTQAALSWSVVWEKTGDTDTLYQARQHIRNSIALEDSPSFLWADLAVLDWYVGDQRIAIEHIRRAIEISDQESSHYLLYGYFLELGNTPEQANQVYQKLIELAPDSCSHPFWQQTSLRAEFACEKPLNYEMQHIAIPNLQEAAFYLEKGDIPQAKLAYQKARWSGENRIASDVLAYQIAKAQGNSQAAKQLAEQIIADDLLFDNYIYNDQTHLIFSRWIYHLKGLDFLLVPGYLQISPDFGQFEVANQYLQDEEDSLELAHIRQLELILDRAMHAGVLYSTLD